MDPRHDQLLSAIDQDDVKTASEILPDGIDLNQPCAELDGAPALFLAILKGNAAMVQLAAIYTAKPLNLARQAHLLMDWEKYHAIVEILERFGGTDEDGHIDSSDLIETTKAEAKRWQS